MLVECVPNVSEGRDPAKIERLIAAVDRTGVALLDRHSDPDHNRTVLTLAGHPEPVGEAIVALAECALREIDLREHAGCHPRLGALDVVPFVPLEGLSQEHTVELATRTAERLATEFELPVYLYAQAATRPERVRLPWLRKPQFEGLADALATQERAPDFGPARPHASGGATVVGARDFLVAFNVDLLGDLALARAIAREIRSSNGGLPGVQARGLKLVEQDRVQVSMNLFDLAQTGIGDAYAAVARAARAVGADVGRAERVGLVPRDALTRGLEPWLGEPMHEGALEDRLAASGLVLPGGSFARTLNQLAGDGPRDPGGGTAAALTLALARGALDKVVALSRGHAKCALDPEAIDALVASVPSTESLLDLGEADQRAFAGVLAAWGLPRGDARKQALRAARTPAVAVPEQQIAAAREIAAAAATLAEDGNPNLVNDAAAACEFALAAARVAALNARSNQTKKARRDYSAQLRQLEAWAKRARQAAGGLG